LVRIIKERFFSKVWEKSKALSVLTKKRGEKGKRALFSPEGERRAWKQKLSTPPAARLWALEKKEKKREPPGGKGVRERGHLKNRNSRGPGNETIQDIRPGLLPGKKNGEKKGKPALKESMHRPRSLWPGKQQLAFGRSDTTFRWKSFFQ